MKFQFTLVRAILVRTRKSALKLEIPNHFSILSMFNSNLQKSAAIISALLLTLSAGPVSAETISLFDDSLPQAVASPTMNNNGFQSQNVRVNTSSFDVFKAKETEIAGLDIPDVIQIALFDGQVIKALYERFESGSGGSVIWIGQVNGNKNNPVFLSINGDILQGNITLDGANYEIRYSNGSGGQTLHSLSHIDPSEMTPEHEPGVPLPSGVLESEEGLPPTADDQVENDSGAVIDVMVVWSPNAETAAGGEAAMIALIDLAVSETNTGYTNSNINPVINLVHAEKITYNSTTSTSTDLTRLRLTNDGFMDEVHTLRNTYSADMVQLIGDYQGISCGSAYVGSSAATAFGLTSFHCATGNYSFGHELGHNQGATHDRQTKGELGNNIGINYGYYVATENWRTIMSYNNADCGANGGCTRLNYWSNPNVNYPPTSTPMGITEGTVNAAENWKVLNGSAVTVANFRSSGDAYEPDNNETEASLIISGIPQTGHSIHDGGADVDWMMFELTCSSSDVVLDTSGASGDTRMWLYDSTLTEIAFNDDTPPDLFSSIFEPGLAAGIYYVKVDEFGNNAAINDYTMTFDAVCGGVPICNGLPVTVDLNLGQSTTAGADVVMGTPGDDDIRGKGGDDTICGMGGDDFIHGNSGDDWIDGGDGVDNLRGGQGDDFIYTGSGATVGSGSRAFGGYGNDSIFGGPDADDLRGGRDVDYITGNGGDDEVSGNEGDDLLFGDDGDDLIKGGLGDSDSLIGGAGNDSLNGGSGVNDSCDGGGDAGDTSINCEVLP